jgi:hypothetical protein
MARKSWWWLAVMAVASVACSGGHDEDLSCDDVSACRAGSLCLNGFCVSMDEATVAASADSAGARVPVLVIDGAGVTCEAQTTCAALPYGTQVTFRAGSAPGFRFTGWTGSAECTGTSVDLVIPTLTHDTHCTANYVRRVKIAGHTSGAEGGVTASSESAFSVCNGGLCEVDAGQPVKLRADDRFGQRFTGWSGAGCGSATNFETTVSAKDDLLCVANFVERIVVSATAMNAEATIAVSSEGAVCEPGSCVLDKGGNATLSAPAVPKFRFAGWSGSDGCRGTDPTLRFSALQQSERCLATYTPRVTVSGSSSGAEPPPAITALSSDLYATCNGGSCDTDVGGGVTLLAGSAAGFRLVGWSGPLCEAEKGAAAVLTNVSADAQCVANYLQGIAVIGAVVGAPGDVLASSTTQAAVCAEGSCVIDIGGNATLTAPSPAGYRFLGWDGDEGCASSALTISFPSVTQSKTCYARFAARYLVRGTSAPAESGTVVASSTSPGAVCENDGCTLDGGGEVSLTVTPRAGNRFSGWSGGGACTGTEPTVRIANVEGNTTCQANFVGRFTVAGIAAPAAGGSVRASSDSGAATCAGATCQVDRGSRVSLTAAAAEGFRFTGWSGCPGGASEATLTLANIALDMACTASFTPLRYTVTSSIAPVDSGTVQATATGGTAQCGAGQCTVDWGSTVSLTAAPAVGWRFGGWTGCATSEEATITLPNVRADATCQARFQRITFVVTAAATPADSGRVAITASGPSAACTGLRCTVPFGGGASLTATPATGWSFGGWTGCSTSMSPVLELLNVTANADCTANFTRQRFDVVGAAVPVEGGTVGASSTAPGAVCSGAGCTVNYGSAVTLVAVPLTGFRFAAWTNCPVTGGASIAIRNVTANVACTATFQRLTFDVVGSAAPTNGGALSVAAMAGATCNGTRCVVEYGGAVTFAATPTASFELTGWTGCTALAADPTRALVANVAADSSCVANFALRTYRVEGVAGTGGSISAATTTSGTCTGRVCTVNHGGNATFTATVDTANGYVFQGWTGCTASAQNPLRATVANVTAAGTCTANFELMRFTVAGNPNAGGAVLAASEGGTCAANSCSVNFGANVTLMALAGTGFRFTGWTACPVTGGPVIQIPNVAANVTCTANFERLAFTVTGAVSPVRSGSLSVAGTTGTCTGTSCVVPYGGSVTYEATDGVGYEFVSWTGCTALADQPRRAAVSNVGADATCVANFRLRSYRVEGLADPGGRISSAAADPGSCTGSVCTVNHGGSVTFSAEAASGYSFSGWSGACTPSPSNALQATASGVTQPGTCTASFRPQTFTVTAAQNGSGRVLASVDGVSCAGETCTVPAGTIVRLTAVARGSRFRDWTCSNTSSTSAVFDVTASANITCFANFVARATVSVAPSGLFPTGTPVTVSGGTQPSCDAASSSCSVDLGSTVTLSTTNLFPNYYYFDRWAPAAGGLCPVTTPASATTTLVANASYSCVAIYNAIIQ